jgi:hypothetical protein
VHSNRGVKTLSSISWKEEIDPICLCAYKKKLVPVTLQKTVKNMPENCIDARHLNHPHISI